MIRATLATLLLAGCGPVCKEGRICAIMGTGELGFNGEDLDALETRLASPTSVLEDPDGHVVVVDYSNMRVRRLTEDGTIETLAGSGIHAYSEIGLDALDTPLENPVDAAWGPDGLLYILPQHEGRVIRVNDSGVIERCAGTGALGDIGDGGDALEAEMGYGGGLAFAEDGALYVSDLSYNRVRRVDPAGTIDTVLGTGEGGMGDPGQGPEVAVQFPERLVVDDARGRLLVADTGNHRVLAMDLETLAVEVLAGTGEPGWYGDGGPATEARLHNPTGVAVTPDGVVLIADLENDRLRAVSPSGDIETVAGQPRGGDLSWSDPPEDFNMLKPAGLGWTSAGDLLIAERGGQRVLLWTGARDAL
ncbi:MAG: hypothetical protein H6739_14885 [Alphaproteobacteria bacterium]|nr:hypothetical protein [Alphaproteobacteria bacterium]